MPEHFDRAPARFLLRAAAVGALRVMTLLLSLALVSHTVAQAAAIDVGNHFLQPNTNGGAANSFELNVTGIENNIQGVNLVVLIGDGGPIIGPYFDYVGHPGPAVSTGVGTGTFNGSTTISPMSDYPGWNGPGSLFHADNNNGINDLNLNNSVSPGFRPYGKQYLEQSVVTTSGVVAIGGSSKLVTLTFDTTGFTSGTWTLALSSIVGITSFGGTAGQTPLTITNGSITIVPEPSSFVLAGLALLTAGVWGWRRNRGLSKL